jgi:hypothetical protein
MLCTWSCVLNFLNPCFFGGFRLLEVTLALLISNYRNFAVLYIKAIFLIWIPVTCNFSLANTSWNRLYSGKFDGGLRNKGKVAPVYAIKAYRGSRGIAPLILNVGTHWTRGWVVSKAGLEALQLPGLKTPDCPATTAYGISASQCAVVASIGTVDESSGCFIRIGDD